MQAVYKIRRYEVSVKMATYTKDATGKYVEDIRSNIAAKDGQEDLSNAAYPRFFATYPLFFASYRKPVDFQRNIII